MKAFVFLLLGLTVCLTEGHARGGHGGGWGGHHGRMAAKRARWMKKRSVARAWFGPVEDPAQCLQGPGEEFELHTALEEMPSSHCTEVSSLL